MHFAFTEEQEELREMARAFLADHSDSERVRQAMESELGWDAEVWKRIGEELGWASVIVPDEYGGIGLGETFLDLAASSAGDQGIDVGLLIDRRFRVGLFLERDADEFVALGIEAALEDADRLEQCFAGIEFLLREGRRGLGRHVVARSCDIIGLARPAGGSNRLGGGRRGDVVGIDGDRSCGTQGDITARVVATSAAACRSHDGEPCNQRAHPARGPYRHPVLLERLQRSHDP